MTTQIMEDQVCNCCGKKMDLFDVNQNAHIHHVVNYGSAYDGDVIDCSLCNDCLDKILALAYKNFAVSPKIRECDI